MLKLTRFESTDGIEILINTETGESFASISGYARMSGMSKSTISRRVAKGVACGDLKMAEIETAGGSQAVVLIPADTCFEWSISDNPELTRAMGRAGATMLMHKMAGFKIQSTAVEGSSKPTPSQITPAHIKAFQFLSKFDGFKKHHPDSAAIFLEWQSVPSVVSLEPTKAIAVELDVCAGRLPSEQALAAMDKAFLNLNRSGLAMNKLFNFVDRVQKMQKIEADQYSGLPEALAEAGEEINRLQEDLKKTQKEKDAANQSVSRQKQKIKQLEQELCYAKIDIEILSKDVDEPKADQPRSTFSLFQAREDAAPYLHLMNILYLPLDPYRHRYCLDVRTLGVLWGKGNRYGRYWI